MARVRNAQGGKFNTPARDKGRRTLFEHMKDHRGPGGNTLGSGTTIRHLTQEEEQDT